MTRPKLFLAPHTTLRGNRAHEWRGTTSGQVPPERRAGSLEPDEVRRHRSAARVWAWLVSLTREAARTGSPFRPGGRAGW